MATPVTSGSIALLRQYLRVHRGVPNPSAALMKALIVNGASIPAGQSHTPDNTRGFGRLDLAGTLTPEPAAHQDFHDDPKLAVATGEVRSFEVRAIDPDLPLRVTLAWTDRPGIGLQNLLYLRVIPSGGGDPIDGDITPFPNPTNNVQRVHIAQPGFGAYTIEVHGIDVLFGIPPLAPAIRQDFAVAINNGDSVEP
jgi:serine protease AprX